MLQDAEVQHLQASYGCKMPAPSLRYCSNLRFAGSADLLPCTDWEPTSEDDDPEVVAAVEAALAAAEPQPPWLSTTCALQYMCSRSQVTFHEVLPWYF